MVPIDGLIVKNGVGNLFPDSTITFFILIDDKASGSFTSNFIEYVPSLEY